MDKQEKSKTGLPTVLIVIFGLFAVIMIGAMYSGDSTQPISETKPSEPLTSAETYYETTFVDGCVKGGGTKSACQCVYDKMQAKWTFEEIKSISSEFVKTNKVPEALSQMTTQCAEI